MNNYLCIQFRNSLYKSNRSVPSIVLGEFFSDIAIEIKQRKSSIYIAAAIKSVEIFGMRWLSLIKATSIKPLTRTLIARQYDIGVR